MKNPTFNFLVALAATASAMPTPTPAPTLSLHHQFVPRDDSTLSVAPTTSTGIYSIKTQYITIQGQTNAHVTIPAKTITIDFPTCIPTITPDANGYVPPGTCNALWDYYPNFDAAVVFAILFAIVTAAHVWQAVRFKKGFCWVIIMASVWETMAFTFRAISSRFQQSVGIYLVFQVFVLLAPLWINAFDYMVLGRMIYYFIPSRSLFSIPAPVIAASFVSLDIISFVIQLIGGSLAGPTSPAADQLRAVHIYMGGIGLQEFFIVIFLLLAARFHREMNTLRNAPTALIVPRRGWKPLLLTLYTSLGLITVRIIFRLVEFSRGSDVSNPILTRESYFYALEAVPMFLALSSFVVIHPGSVLVGPESHMPGFFTTLKDIFRGKKSTKGWKEVSDGEETEMVTRYEGH